MLGMKNFIKDMPPASDWFRRGTFFSCTFKIGLFRNFDDRLSKKPHKYIITAYLHARLMALKHDMETPGQEHGIGWSIRGK
jgi:hypothetical protein